MNILELINNFVKDITGIDFIKEPLSCDFEKIPELKETHEAIIDIIKSQRKPYLNELAKNIYSLLEISVEWNDLNKCGRITQDFRKHCKRLFQKQSDFYGTGFEIDMASRALLSGWEIDYPEDYIKKSGKKPIDFTFIRNKAYCGVGGNVLVFGFQNNIATF